MKTSGEKFNVNFVKLVQDNPCIWDSKSKYYRNKKILRQTWQKISKQLNAPVEICPDRWRKIRDAFYRSIRRHLAIKNTNRKQKPYYLTPHLQFLLPQSMKKYKYETINPNDTTNLDSESEDCKPGPFLEESRTNETLESFQNQTELDSASSLLLCEGTAFKNDVQESRNNEQYYDMIDKVESVFDKQRKIKEEEDDNDSDMNFFKSLLRDVRKMSDKQNRKFRMRVLQIVDEICDESSELDHQKKN